MFRFLFSPLTIKLPECLIRHGRFHPLSKRNPENPVINYPELKNPVMKNPVMQLVGYPPSPRGGLHMRAWLDIY
jgi:hypothetical protein